MKGRKWNTKLGPRNWAKYLTLDVEVENVAFRFAFPVGCRASVAPGAVTADALQHQTLIGGDDAGRDVVIEFLLLCRRPKHFGKERKQRLNLDDEGSRLFNRLYARLDNRQRSNE